MKLGFYALDFFVWQSVELEAIFLPACESERKAKRKKAGAENQSFRPMAVYNSRISILCVLGKLGTSILGSGIARKYAICLSFFVKPKKDNRCNHRNQAYGN